MVYLSVEPPEKKVNIFLMFRSLRFLVFSSVKKIEKRTSILKHQKHYIYDCLVSNESDKLKRSILSNIYKTNTK